MSKIVVEPYNNGNTQLVRDENGCLYLVEGEIVEDDEHEDVAEENADDVAVGQPGKDLNPFGTCSQSSVSEFLEETPRPLPDDEDLFVKWTNEATMFLLETRFGMFDQFNHPNSKKRRLWEDIGKKLTEEADFKVDGATCDNKFRNLLNTYRKLKERKDTHGKENIKWAFFDLFEEYMARIAAKPTARSSLSQAKKGKIVFSEVDENEDSSYVHTKIEMTHEDVPQLTSDTGNDSEFILKWSHEAILVLLETRFSLKAKFGRPECKKKILWEEVARKINQISTLKVDGTACDNKYRNLLNTYRKIKDKNMHTGTDMIKWPYFDMIDENLASRTYKPNLHTLGGSLNVTMDDEESAADDLDEPFNSRKRKRGDTIRDVLEKKIKLNTTRFEQKQQKKESHWRERRTIEEKKINVLSTISNGLQQLIEKELNESYRDVLEEKIKVDHHRYDDRQEKKETRWRERKDLEEKKIQVLMCIADCLKKLTAKI